MATRDNFMTQSCVNIENYKELEADGRMALKYSLGKLDGRRELNSTASG
jgi:hypothetical protein